MRRLWSFLRAVLGGRDRSLIAERMAICGGCEHLDRRPEISRDSLKLVTKQYCKQCGCGTYALAELHHKLGYKALRCPIGKWGEATSMTPAEASGQIGRAGMAAWRATHPKEAAELDAKQAEAAAKAKAAAAAARQNGTANQGRPRALPEAEFQSTFRTGKPPGRQIFGPENTGPVKGFNDGD